MGFWFANDFTDASCLDFGGDDECPCGTPGLWNTNWYACTWMQSAVAPYPQCVRFSNIIGIPGYVGEVCILLNDTLTPTELGNCTKFTSRAYNTFVTGINGVSAITGANSKAHFVLKASILTRYSTALDLASTIFTKWFMRPVHY
jgi:hypothetical protein